MQPIYYLQLIIFFLLLIFLSRWIGLYIYQVLSPNECTVLDPLCKPIEKWIYRICHINPSYEQNWKEYLLSLLSFSIIATFFIFFLLQLQFYLPGNPQNFPAPSLDLSLNIAISFMTNTNWQSYGGESTLSYFSQMAALTVQNFVSAAVGLSAAAVLVRGIAWKLSKTIGNFWVDLVRILLYLLLPLSILAAGFFLSEGVPQNFKPYMRVQTIEGNEQIIPQGPIASQEAIKILGTNGGGFLNANSAHPYENPTPLSNFFQILCIFLIPGAQLYYFGCIVKNTKHIWCIFAALSFIFIVGVAICTLYETEGNPAFERFGVATENWEGKDVRFGLFGSTFYAGATTSVACGSVNAMHDSFTPIGGMIPMLNMQLGSVIFGGIGAGLCEIILFIFLSIFIAGLIIGRTPEYFGKKLEPKEIKLTVLAVISYAFLVYLLTACSSSSSWGAAGLANTGSHGFSEILYAFSSCVANNGSAFAGLSTNTPVYNLTLAAAMLLGRFFILAPVIAIGGYLAEKNRTPKSLGSFPVTGWIFGILLLGVILILGMLTFFPSITLGPIVEHFSMIDGAEEL